MASPVFDTDRTVVEYPAGRDYVKPGESLRVFVAAFDADHDRLLRVALVAHDSTGNETPYTVEVRQMDPVTVTAAEEQPDGLTVVPDPNPDKPGWFVVTTPERK